MSKALKYTFVLLILAACVYGCTPNNSPTPVHEKTESKKNNKEVVLSVADQEGVVQVENVSMNDTPELLRVPGKITLSDRGTWRVGVRTDGMVMIVNAGLGDFVQKGQILARFHADEVRDTRAMYRTALSELERAKTGVTLAERNYARAQSLLELKAGSAQQVEITRQEVAGAQAAVKKAEIEVDRCKDLLEDDLRVPADPKPGADETEDLVPIIAPATGYIIQKNVTPGKTIDRTTDTFIIGDLSRLWMIASVDEGDIAQLSKGLKATVTTKAFPSDQFPGTVTDLGPELDATTRVLRVRIELQNPSTKLRPEMLATAQIQVNGSKSRMLVPTESLQQINDQDVVFVRTSADRFEVRAVRLGDTFNNRVAILDGLKAGETVVTHGTFLLKSQLLKSSLENE